MHWLIYPAIGIAIVALILIKRRPDPLSEATQAAIESAKLDKLIEYLQSLPERARIGAYDKAIKEMWRAYERPLAIRLVKHLGVHHHESSTAQYWIRNVLEVEPELARKSFNKKFLEEHLDIDALIREAEAAKAAAQAAAPKA